MSSRKYPLAGALALLLVLAAGCRGNDADDDGWVADAGAPADGAGADAEPGPHPGEVWVMTWNLQTFPKAVSTVGRVSQILPGLAPDIVGVEEIGDLAAFNALDEQLPDYEGVVATNGDGFSRVGLMYRPATVTIGDVRTLCLGDGSAFPRPPLAVHVSAQGIDFQVVVLHLKAQGDAASQARRKDAIDKLDAWLTGELAAAPDATFLLVGDWNDELTDPEGENVFASMLGQPERYTFLTLPLAEMPAESTFIPIAGSFIDHMMLTSNGLDEWGAGTTSVLHLDDSVNQYQASISDHRPVLTKFRPSP